MSKSNLPGIAAMQADPVNAFFIYQILRAPEALSLDVLLRRLLGKRPTVGPESNRFMANVAALREAGWIMETRSGHYVAVADGNAVLAKAVTDLVVEMKRHTALLGDILQRLGAIPALTHQIRGLVGAVDGRP